MVGKRERGVELRDGAVAIARCFERTGERAARVEAKDPVLVLVGDCNGLPRQMDSSRGIALCEREPRHGDAGNGPATVPTVLSEFRSIAQ